MQVARQAHRLSQRPGAVRVQRDAGLRKARMQRAYRLHFGLAGQRAALELEVAEAVARVRGLGQAHHRLRRQRHLIAQAKPVVVGTGFCAVAQIGLVAVADVEQIAQHLHRLALLAPRPTVRPPARPGAGPAGPAAPDSTAVTAWMVVRKSNVCRPRPPLSRSAKRWRIVSSSACMWAMGWPHHDGAAASSSVARIFSPPGTSPMPVWPALSVRISRLRVK